MEKEKVTEELVRQNGNQSAAVMADYARQGGGGLYGYLEIGELLNGRIASLNEEEYWQTDIPAREFEEYCKLRKLDMQDLKGFIISGLISVEEEDGDNVIRIYPSDEAFTITPLVHIGYHKVGTVLYYLNIRYTAANGDSLHYNGTDFTLPLYL